MKDASALRRLVRPLARTPLHPQWLIKRSEAAKWRWIVARTEGRVLDIGCADGIARRHIAGTCEYIGLDYPKTATGMYGTRPDVFADGARIPFNDAIFDTVLLLDVLEHVADAHGVLREAARVLKPHGHLLVTMPFLYPIHDAPYDFRRYTHYGLLAALENAGFMPTAPITSVGGAFETTALLAALACATTVAEIIERPRWPVLLLPLLIAAIPCLNLVGWTAQRIFGCGSRIAHGYHVDAQPSPGRA